jgi:methylenetetrahydrofolate dehydrogenase (NADP+)/methenyltetrahydrofolate cyclohydrolase
VREQVQELRQGGVQPGWRGAGGRRPASQVYVRNKVLRAEEVGIRSLEHRLPPTPPRPNC